MIAPGFPRHKIFRKLRLFTRCAKALFQVIHTTAMAALRGFSVDGLVTVHGKDGQLSLHLD